MLLWHDALGEICLGWFGPSTELFLRVGKGISLSLGALCLREVVDILEMVVLSFKIIEINHELANNRSVL